MIRNIRKKAKIIGLLIVIFICVNLSLIFTDSKTSDAVNDDDEFDSSMIRSKLSTTVKTTTVPVFERDKLRNDSKLFHSLKEAHAYMQTVTSLKDHQLFIVHYSQYSRHLPRFINNTDEEYFMKSRINLKNLQPVPQEQLRGMIDVIPNGTFQMEYTCGFGSDSEYFKRTRASDFVKYYDTLVPLVIPMGFLFQHFFDGTFPKIVQAYEYIKRPETKIILERPNHDNVYRILERLNISQSKVVWHRRNDVRTVYHAKYMINTCVTPPMHPSLWQQMRSMLGVSDTLTVPLEDSLVMLLTRAGATNGGRNALNMNAVYEYLSSRYGKRLVVFDSQQNLNQAMHTFSQVHIIIGTHGGSFYNLNYAPANTPVIEFVPYDYGGADVHALPHAIFWAMANIIGQPYWRIMCKSENYQHDMIIDIDKLSNILDLL